MGEVQLKCCTSPIHARFDEERTEKDRCKQQFFGKPRKLREAMRLTAYRALKETGADLTLAPAHSPPSPSVLPAVCHSHMDGHRSRHRGEYSGTHQATQKSFQTQ